MTHFWRFLDTGVNSAFFNMALDEALLLCSCNTRYPVLRLYSWSSPSISIGYFQNAEKCLNLVYCKENSIDVVRRITGGRAVYHDKEVTYSIIIPKYSKFFKNNNLELYRFLSGGLLSGLKKIGIDCKLEKPTTRRSCYQDKANCFSATSSYEITAAGKKLVGSAQKWSDIGVIQQGSILIRMNKERLCKIFNKSNVDGFMNSNFTTISEVSGLIPSHEVIVNSLKKGFEESLGINFIDSGLRNSELDTMNYLIKNKYSNDLWNHESKII
jgi:lipoyl(octanoyl) transferase